MVVCATTLCADSNVSDARVFRAEVRSQKINLANRFKRRLAGSGLAKNATVRTLPIERKAGAIALRSDEFKRAVGGALRDVRIQIKEGVHVATVAGKLDNLGVVQRLAYRLVLGIDSRRLHGDHHALLCRRNLEDRVGAHGVAAAQDDVGDFFLAHSNRGDDHFVHAGF